MSTTYEKRHNVHPDDAKRYDTERLRKEFLADNLMNDDKVHFIYSFIDRYIVGGAVPKTKALELESIEPLKADYFLERREMGIINVGGKGKITADGETYELNYKEALYLGRGTKKVTFESVDSAHSAHYYINSAPAHTSYPNKLVTMADANVLELGALESSNARKVNQLIINGIVETCQLQMGLTELQPGSVWNTMPAHTHDRRMEAYFYFSIPEGQSVCHFMGEPKETRHIWIHNEQAVLSPSWSIHSGAGTSNYNFIWGMAGENLDYSDMDFSQPYELR